MKSGPELYYQAAKESLLNARSWLEDANHFLYEKKEYGHPLSLTLFSLEESMKAWVCFSVGIGNLDPTDETVKEMFSSHSTKMESVLIMWLVVNSSLIQKTLWTTLTAEEVNNIRRLFSFIDENFDSAHKQLLDLRMKGMYVDIKNGKISTPNDISKFEVEGFLYDAFKFLQHMEQTLKEYNEADPDGKVKIRDIMNTSTEQMKKNLQIIKSAENDKKGTGA